VVRSLRRAEGGTFVARAGDKDIVAATVVIATGLVDECPTIEGLAARHYVGPIRFCPICDGFEALDKRVGVLGDWTSAPRKALFMRTYTREVVLFPTIGASPEADDRELQELGIVVAARPTRIAVESEGVIVTVESGLQHRLDVLYPALGCQVNSELAAALNAACDETGMIRVDAHQKTSVDGLYAAGDVVTDLHQLSVATAHAAIAATHIHNTLPRNPR
jgi:thioredoxin reductase (NADPH)